MELHVEFVAGARATIRVQRDARLHYEGMKLSSTLPPSIFSPLPPSSLRTHSPPASTLQQIIAASHYSFCARVSNMNHRYIT